MNVPSPFAILRVPQRIWVVGAIHNNHQKLKRLHRTIASKLKFNDKLIYTGNIIGHHSGTIQTIKELLSFRRYFLSRPPLSFPHDIIYLRGRQEEMLMKLTSLHFASKPSEIIKFACHAGLTPVIREYGLDYAEFNEAAHKGTTELVKHTTNLSATLRRYPGHMKFYTELKHAAYSEDGIILCVSSGLNPREYLQQQGDELWWGGAEFNTITHVEGGFCRLIRGYDPLHAGYNEKPFTLSLDGGNHFEELHAVCINRHGDLLEKISL